MIDPDSTRIHVILPKDFLKALDQEARNSYLSRSEFIRLALMQKMCVKSLINPNAAIEEEVEKRFQKKWEEFVDSLPDE
jgi:hypothetical protein